MQRDFLEITQVGAARSDLKLGPSLVLLPTPFLWLRTQDSKTLCLIRAGYLHPHADIPAQNRKSSQTQPD